VSEPRSVAASLEEYGRGVAGGLIFSLPLLYTQEVWDIGAAMGPGRLLAGLGATFLLLIGYNRFAGLRRDAGWAEVLIDSVEELGIGLLLAAFVLWLLHRVSAEMQPAAVVGAVMLEGLLAAIGVSVGTAQLGGGEEQGDEEQGDEDKGGKDQGHGQGAGRGVAGRLALSACGAILIAANVAPTEEVLIIAGAAGGWRLLASALLAMLLTALIVFFSDFVGSGPRPPGFTMLRVTVNTYAVALLGSAALLWFFGRLEGQAVDVVIARIVVLSLPAALGASAGRLLLQGGG